MAVIAGNVYEQDRIVSASGELTLLTKAATIGNTISNNFKISLLDPDSVPRTAKIELKVRMTDGNQHSEWINKGTYFVDTRSKSESNILTLNAFDSMLKADQLYLENSELSTWPANENSVVAEIASLMGVTVDSRTTLAGYYVPIPEQDWTCREVLGWIGAANCGNWTITPSNELYLVPFGGVTSLLSSDYSTAILMGDSFILLSTEVAYDESRQYLSKDENTAIKFGSDYVILNGKGNSVGSIGRTWQDICKNAESFENLGVLQPFTGAKLWRSHENTYVDEQVETEVDGALSVEIIQVEVEQSVMAGDDTGRVLEADCPWATQEMVDAILTRIEGYCYQSATAQKALVTPALELGDTCICNGVTFPVCQISEDYSDLYAPTLSCTADEQIDYEYRYTNKLQRQLNRKVSIGENYYGFKVTREDGIEVTNIVDGVETTRMRLNSNVQEFLNEDGERALYFDAEAGEYKFKGNVTITQGSLGLSSKFAIYPPDATEQEIDAYSITVPDGFSLIDRYNGNLYRFLSIYQYDVYTHFESAAGGYAAWDFSRTEVNGEVNLRDKAYYYGSGKTIDADAEIATMGDIPTLPTTGPWKAAAFDISANTNKYIKVARDPSRLRTGMIWLISSTANKNGYYFFARGTGSSSTITLTTIKAVTQSGMSVSVSTQDTDYIAIIGATGYVYGVMAWFSGDKPEIVSALPT